MEEKPLSVEDPSERILFEKLEERLALCLEGMEECIEPEEFRDLLAREDSPVAYDGFEPSGRMHIAQGLMKALFVRRWTRAGFVYIFYIADWFAQLNHKMGGDKEKIRTVGEYFIEVWSACGIDLSRVKFLWASEEISARMEDYMSFVIDISTRTTLKRAQRCLDIQGRKKGDSVTASSILYTCMQCADIFFLGVDVCQLGMDQRKVHMLAREYASATHRTPPIILSHPMLMGLKKGQEKMSKSTPDSAIFMEDSWEEVERKIRSAYCPPERELLSQNPCLNYFRHLIFPTTTVPLRIERAKEHGDDLWVANYEEMEDLYADGKLHPSDLKNNLARFINEKLEPIRKHFETDPKAHALLEKVKSFKTSF